MIDFENPRLDLIAHFAVKKRNEISVMSCLKSQSTTHRTLLKKKERNQCAMTVFYNPEKKEIIYDN